MCHYARLSWQSLPLLLGTVLLAACGDAGELPVQTEEAPTQISLLSNGQDPPPEEPTVFGEPDKSFVFVAENVPGFAGVVVEDGKKTVLVQKGKDPNASRRAVGLPDAPTRFVIFDFLTLARWYGPFVEALEAEAFWTDIDESSNRLLASVRDVERAAEILAAAGIPDSLYHLQLQRGRELVNDTTLDDQFRPVPGGVNVSCTVGFNVNHWRWGPAFITASHCTDTEGVDDDEVFFQPGGSVDQIGEEQFDPAWWSSAPDDGTSCPTANCRYGDWTLIQYITSIEIEEAKIARPETEGSLNLDDQHSRYSVVGEFHGDQLLDGVSVAIVGHTGGLMLGDIVQTCTTETTPNAGGSAPSDARYVCQFHSDGPDACCGDSGGPAFGTRPDSVDADLAGVQWLLDGNLFGDDNVWSPVFKLRAEMDPDSSLACSGITTTVTDGCERRSVAGAGGGSDCPPDAFECF